MSMIENLHRVNIPITVHRAYGHNENRVVKYSEQSSAFTNSAMNGAHVEYFAALCQSPLE